eukprot:8743-Prorocentrum_lima.AAC.1
MLKKIILVDQACSLARHLTQAGSALFLREVEEALCCPASACPQSSDAHSDGTNVSMKLEEAEQSSR